MGLLEAALIGGRTRGEHPAVPITADNQASDAVAVVRGGAGAIHFHIRSDRGRETLSRLDLVRALDQMRSHLPRIPIGVSTGAWILNDPKARYAAIAEWQVWPDFASVNLHEPGADELIQLLLGRGTLPRSESLTSTPPNRSPGIAWTPNVLRIRVEPKNRTTKPLERRHWPLAPF